MSDGTDVRSALLLEPATRFRASNNPITLALRLAWRDRRATVRPKWQRPTLAASLVPDGPFNPRLSSRPAHRSRRCSVSILGSDASVSPALGAEGLPCDSLGRS